MKRINETWILRIVIVLSAIIGYMVAHYFSDSLTRWICKDDLVSDEWLLFGIATSTCLFIYGYIDAKIRRR